MNEEILKVVGMFIRARFYADTDKEREATLDFATVAAMFCQTYNLPKEAVIAMLDDIYDYGIERFVEAGLYLPEEKVAIPESLKDLNKLNKVSGAYDIDAFLGIQQTIH